MLTDWVLIRAAAVQMTVEMYRGGADPAALGHLAVVVLLGLSAPECVVAVCATVLAGFVPGRAITWPWEVMVFTAMGTFGRVPALWGTVRVPALGCAVKVPALWVWVRVPVLWVWVWFPALWVVVPGCGVDLISRWSLECYFAISSLALIVTVLRWLIPS